MITQAHRFHGLGSLRFVYRYGQTVRTPQIALRYVVNDRYQTWRIAVVVSRKVSKSAVTRNRIRRRIYEIIRLHQAHIIGLYDIVMIVYSPQLVSLEPDTLTKLVTELLQKAGVMTSSSSSPEHDIVDNKEN